MRIPTLSQFTKAARTTLEPADEGVPYAFEKRVMARLAGRGMAELTDLSAGLAGIMWRAALSCLAISLVTSAVVTFASPSGGDLFATDLERTVLAPVDVDDTW